MDEFQLVTECLTELKDNNDKERKQELLMYLAIYCSNSKGCTGIVAMIIMLIIIRKWKPL
ncbi:hypothetical protein RhiirA5_425276 [Rhizophagus irregularis]|uniref:Uncharacterized protein n=1 Tax=Rhizophagus irregularis TaxID=588596 RepID=A0A2N0RGD7_9GLOM|nr:hypothetical protein RhiirA5_425276 [Rhizophagus irregularis]PKC62373.1 hypothetical protein RhiirA1_465223 [Rhizophagus irregularis]